MISQIILQTLFFSETMYTDTFSFLLKSNVYVVSNEYKAILRPLNSHLTMCLVFSRRADEMMRQITTESCPLFLLYLNLSIFLYLDVLSRF